ncbi:MAG: type I CRISPR-associated protein Cas7 [Bacteroidetes bacterium]|jgi:CRISPR-associated protein Csh2|nr:type I CRISPR-associated protein Cas7 [Bacteroidota bacterium]MBT6687727.1 type I CRISPR-associated protein Cas7 [Bacteroidota bacterium]MBT7143679.1 type I CRISPR-associated protein Cas7 [Bacteroidota bacterium]MBT7493285.1 type I CRISPR-associated protein Cas7 [Bacteroidota bacterium]
MEKFKNRVFGAAIVKAINSNYNADFSGQPRTLPNGNVYATDKAFKYTVKNYIKDVYQGEKVFYFKRLNDEFNPLTLEDSYFKVFNTDTAKDKKVVAQNILSCIDVRFFGATFAMSGKAGKVALSVHGPVQVNHGINIWAENNIYSEQITAPFSSPGEKEKEMTTIGRQSKLEEGHYLHHFSVNPKNLGEVVALAGEDADNLSAEDINKLKEAMRRGATYYDSASKAGTENEFLIWVQLNENSKLVLPNFNNLIKMKDKKQNGKVVLDLSGLSEELKQHSSEIAKIEIFRNDTSLVVENKPEGAIVFGM